MPEFRWKAPNILHTTEFVDPYWETLEVDEDGTLKLFHICGKLHSKHSTSIKVGKIVFCYNRGTYYCWDCRRPIDTDNMLEETYDTGYEGHA